MRLNDQLEAVKATVESAFASISYPGDDNVIRKTTPNFDGVTLLIGKHWNEIAPGPRKGAHWVKKQLDLLYSGADFPLFSLTDEGYIFYLPAYLIACIDYWNYEYIAIPTLHYLSPLFNQEWLEDFEKQWGTWIIPS